MRQVALDRVDALKELRRRDTALGAHPTRNQRPASEAASRELRPEAHDLFLEDLKAGLADRQGGRLSLLGDHVEVVGHALKLGVDRPPPLCALRRLHADGTLDRLAERERVGDARDAGDPLGHMHRRSRRHADDPLLERAVFEERARRDPGDVLAAGLDQELDRLEHPRAHRTERQ